MFRIEHLSRPFNHLGDHQQVLESRFQLQQEVRSDLARQFIDLFESTFYVGVNLSDFLENGLPIAVHLLLIL